MSFPDKQQRKSCWDSRDRYWECLDDQNIKDSSVTPKVCAELRRIFEKSCPPKWVTHFDRKRDYDIFKQKMQKEGFEPIKDNTSVRMEQLDYVILKLNIPTKDIRSEDLQEVMTAIKKSSNCNKNFEEYYNAIVEKLWCHLTNELVEFDDQLLCCTCFYSVLNHCKTQELYLNKVLTFLNNEVLLDTVEKKNVSVSLCYGMFQSSYLIQLKDKPVQLLENLLKTTFQLLLLMAYQYSQYTFIVFKTITAFKKVIGTPIQEFLFNRDNNINLLNLINHNWENPITGVRNLNRIIFRILLMVLDRDMYKKVLDEIYGFYWNKAKFLMLAEIIEHNNDEIESVIQENNIIFGLVLSLHNSGLVSAGSDMYHAILKRCNSEKTWVKLFLTSVIKLLISSSLRPIENFKNYWCLATLKKFPTLAQALINALQKHDESEFKLYSYLSVIKQANKLGLFKSGWLTSNYNLEENIVLSCLEHCNASVRMLMFEIICVSNRQCFPSNMEYEHILNFLQNNVNSDHTVLRLSVLNHLASFLTTLHTSFLKYSHDYKGEDIYNLNSFCINLQIFTIESLNNNGNYQRKITTVKIAYLILKHFSEVPEKKKKQCSDTNISLIDYLKQKDHWLLNSSHYIKKLISLLKDPATDVHEITLQLLLEFYLPEISDTNEINSLIEQSLKCIQSKFFFEISCGLNIFKLIVNIIIQKNAVEAKFRTIEDIFYFALNEITLDYNAKEIMDSIKRGKQLHSFLSILCIIFDVISRNEYKLVLSDEQLTSLFNILKNINQFASEESTSTSSDFSKIDDMVHSLIKASEFDDDMKDDANFSGLYKVVLNCLWLNVKATCELSSILIQYYIENITICESCLCIITNVLETSRHKGAIEAAGAALGKGIRYITSYVNESEVSQLPMSLLKRKLNELLYETTSMSSVTRRGAGLSIMIHRIVSNDVKKGKPLFNYFMKTILKVSQEISEINQEVDDDKDMPKAIYIHFLTRIVTDSSLSADVMHYSAELAQLAFYNLTNPHWQIRNAALQLYGALIPKLIGQKKQSGTGTDEEILTTVACDEFRTHSPKLWDNITKQIKCINYTDIIQAHSNLVPILNTLANIARRYNFSYDVEEQKAFDFTLLPSLFALLSSPIYTVRRLASKCILNIYSFDVILDSIRKVNISSENYVHGILMVMENCYEVYSDIEMFKNQLDSIRNDYYKVLNKERHSYLCLWTLDLLYEREIQEVSIEMMQKLLLKENTIRQEPGASLYMRLKIQRCLGNVTWARLPEIITLLLKSYEFEHYCEIIAQRIKASEDISEKVLTDISVILLSSSLKNKSSNLWKTLYYISLKIKVMQISLCYQENLHCDVSYNMRYMVLFATRLFAEHMDNENLLHMSKNIFNLCNPNNNDIDMRYIAVMANNELAYKFKNLSDNIRINAIKSAVALLQDEDEDVRDLSVNFYQRIVNEKHGKHPFLCLTKILTTEFFYTHFNEPFASIETICKDLLSFIDSINISIDNELNPFANNSKNIYLEVQVLQQMLINLNKI